jgi:GMP synthase-like glutamine amidotransferase
VRVLLTANRGDDDPGHVGTALAARGAVVEVAHRDGPHELPDPVGFDVVVALGSDWSVYWPHVAAHVTREEALLRAAVDAEVPVLGICFGAQVLASALGGLVERAPEPEVGWYLVDTDVPDLLPPGPYLQWHWDRFAVPPGGVELARSPVGPQAFVLGSAFGVQFHPEATAPILRRWSHGDDGPVEGTSTDAGTVVAEAERRHEEAAGRADVLVASFLSGALTGHPVPAAR